MSDSQDTDATEVDETELPPMKVEVTNKETKVTTPYDTDDNYDPYLTVELTEEEKDIKDA